MKGEVKNESYMKKGLWSEEEDRTLMAYIDLHGKGKWNRVSNMTGLRRCGKSCRLRWMNYLSPNIKRGDFSEEEDDLIIRLHKLLGNRWSLIAGRVPGRTDNQVKNHWNTHLSKKLGLKKQKCHNDFSRLVGKTTKETPRPTLVSFPQQLTENECPPALKLNTDELTTCHDDSTGAAAQDWFIDNNGLDCYTDQDWMNYVNGHHAGFVWDEL